MSQINKTNTNKKKMLLNKQSDKESDKDETINKKEEIEILKNKNKELEEKLKSYTNAQNTENTNDQNNTEFDNM
jgi:hypothetical protein